MAAAAILADAMLCSLILYHSVGQAQHSSLSAHLLRGHVEACKQLCAATGHCCQQLHQRLFLSSSIYLHGYTLLLPIHTFPIQHTAPVHACRHSAAASQYAQQLFTIMDGLVAAAREGHAAGVAGGLQAVLQAVQDMGSTEGHMYQEALQARLALLAAACWLPPASATAAGTASAALPAGGTSSTAQAVQAVQETPELARLLLEFCWQQLFCSRQCSVPLRAALCKHLLLPLLQLAPPPQRLLFYQQRLQHAYDVAQGKAGALPELAGQERHVLSARACAYRLLEIMYRWVGL